MIYSQKKTSLFTSILVVGTSATILIHYFVRNYIYQDYLQIDNFMFTLIPFAIAFIFYWFYNENPEYIFDENYIQVFGKSQIQRFKKEQISEVSHFFVVMHKNSESKYIEIITNDRQKFQINHEYYKNFDEIEWFLRENYNLKYTPKKNLLNYKILMCFAVLYITMMSALIIEPNEKGVQQVKVVLGSKPNIHYGGSKSSTDNIEFKFQKLDKFSTTFSDNKVNRNYVELAIANMYENDTLTIEIPKNYYDKKIAKTEPLTFIDKHFKYNKMPVYYVYDKRTNEVLTTSYP